MNQDLLKKKRDEDLDKIKKECLHFPLFIGAILFFVLSIFLLYFNEHFICFTIVFALVIVGELLSYFRSTHLSKERYLYLVQEKKFPYEPIAITKEKFVSKCLQDSFMVYLLINNNIHYIEIIHSQDSVQYIIDYEEFSDLQDFLDYKIDGNQSFCTISTFYLVSCNEGDPVSFFSF